MTMEKFRSWIAPVSQAIAVLVVLVGIATWGINLKAKVDELEGQLGELKSAMTSQQKPNSILTACTNLSDHFAAALALHSKYGDSDFASIRSLMVDLGCMNVPRQ